MCVNKAGMKGMQQCVVALTKKSELKAMREQESQIKTQTVTETTKTNIYVFYLYSYVDIYGEYVHISLAKGSDIKALCY